MRTILLMLLVSFGVGCNALYLRETERFSLTIEGKPDATEPVSGNFGYKQRIALVVPGTKDGAHEDNDDHASVAAAHAEASETMTTQAQTAANRALGEAVSMISFYDFVKEPGKNWLSDAITIRSAFVTGQAAISLNVGQTQKMYMALAARPIPTDDDNAKAALENVAAGDMEEFRRLVAKDWKTLTPQEKTRAGQITGAQSSYSKQLHDAIRKRLEQQ